MARPPPRGSSAPLASPAGRDRAPPRSSGRHAHRLPQSRQGDRDHPRGGRSEAGVESGLRPLRCAGDLYSRHKAAQLAAARGNAAAPRKRDLAKEKREIEALLGDEAKQWKAIAAQIRELKKKYGPDTKSGAAARALASCPDIAIDDIAGTMIEREPVTVVVSEKGWIRALKGNVEDLSSLQFKGDDELVCLVFHRDHLQNSGACERRQEFSRLRQPSCRAGAAKASRSV